MKIIVMCETSLQFNNYVDAVLHNESKSTRRTVERCHSSILIHIENLEFIFCKNTDTLRGRSFSKNDRIVRVGSWYNISEETQEDIVAMFMLRTVP